jgi:hypothetical protein
MNALRNALSGNRAGLLVVGLAFLAARGMCAQQPTEADSAAVFALAVERIIASDSIGHIQGSGPPVRLSEAPKAAWAARAVARLRTIERPGAEPELLSVTAPQFTGDTAVVYESRHRCYPGGYMGGTGTEYMFVRTAEGWQVAPGGGFDNIDGICLRRPTGKRAGVPASK